MKKRFFYAAGLAFLAGITWCIFYLNTLLPIITGYPAKYLCSAVFISHRNPAAVEASELDFSFIRYVTSTINYREKSVTSRFLWGHSTAVYREGFGSMLLRDADEGALKKTKSPPSARIRCNQDTIAWPAGNIIPAANTGIDRKALLNIANRLVVHRKYNGRAFALIVVHKGIPVAEQYDSGFNAKTRFLSWSVAKSFTNALAGIMVKDGLLNIDQRANIPAWKADDRNKITINDLIQMQSGLRWNEDYGNRSDVTLMLYRSADFARFAIEQPLEYPAGSHWYYSSGSANIVSYLMRRQFNNDSAYYAYTHTRFFDKTGMPDAIFETDPSGTLVGSSYIYATARDYARFGLLYLWDGMFNGERILPEGWAGYTTTPASHSDGNYGAFFWLNKGKHYPSAPADMYYCNGHEGQRIFIIPSRDLVVVILGYSPKPDRQMNFDQLLKDILGTLPG
ncbi:MAG: serine hydrolase [Bacteroidetes bacterium]|nr:serine hydrolase [Bacteroidota bacterium]